MVKIFQDMLWKGKRLGFTWHFYEEWDRLGKPLSFVLDILEDGEHELVSKRQRKYLCRYPWRGAELCLAYVEQEEYILIHIKPRRRR